MTGFLSKLPAAVFYLWTHGTLRRVIYLVAALVILVITGIHSMAVEKSRPGIDLSMNGSRALYGMITATSNYGFGSPLHSFYKPIFDIFYTKGTHTWDEVNGLIDKAMALDPNTLTPNNLNRGFGELDSDDKGIILWHWAAFELFGPHVGSIYLFYFMLIAISMVAFWLAHRRDEAAVMLLPLYALSHSAMAAYVLAGPTDTMGTLITSRPFAMLAALPALHLALLIIRKTHFSRWLAAGAIYQIAFLLLVITVRSSTKTQLIFLLLVAGFMGLCWLRREVGSFKNLPQHLISRDFIRRPLVWVMTFLLIGSVSLATFYVTAVPSDIRARSTTGHVFWHAMLAGFILDKEVLARELWQWGNHVEPLPEVPTNNDKLAYNATMGFHIVKHNNNLMKATGGGPDNRDMKIYEAAARELFFYELKRSPFDVAHLFIIRKSYELRDMARNVRNQLDNGPARSAAFVFGLMAGIVWLRSLKIVAPLMFVGLAIASVPAYVFAAGTHIMYDYAPYFYMCFLGISTTLGAITSLLVIYAARLVLGRKYETLIQSFHRS